MQWQWKYYSQPDKRKAKDYRLRHQANFKNTQKEKSSIAEHWVESGYYFSEINLLKEVQKPKYLDANEFTKVFMLKFLYFVNAGIMY